MKKVEVISRVIFFAISVAMLCFISLLNFAPLGTAIKVIVNQEVNSVTALTPKERVRKVNLDKENVIQQLDSMIYFMTPMSFNFEKAIVKIRYIPDDDEQEISVGFKDEPYWHYSTKPISSPILDSVNWEHVGEDPVLLQKRKTYSSYREFIKNPPHDSLVGLYELNANFSNTQNLDNYKPSNKITKITTPMRGKHTFYVYLKNEPFKMDIEKQDLNIYQGQDVVRINIYKDNDLVYEETIDDDGITNTSRGRSSPQTVHIQNPGPEFPESGVYKVVLNLNQDTVIKSIKTNLNKIVFEGTIFPVANKDIYSWIIQKSEPTSLYADTMLTTFVTHHDAGLQTVQHGDQALVLNREKEEVSATSSAQGLTKITIPKSDVLVKGYMGYFAFSPEQYFRPLPFYTVPIVHEDQLNAVDYVLTSYIPPHYEGKWKVATAEFDLTKAVTDEGKLSWLIKSPGLKENNRSVLIKSIEVTLIKKPMPFVAKLFNINE